MNKKIRNLLIAVSGLALSVGAAVGLGMRDTEVKEAEASGTAKLEADEFIFISLKQYNWYKDDIKTTVRFTNSETGAHALSAKYVTEYKLYDGTNSIYIVDVPDGTWTNFECGRVNPTGAPSTPTEANDAWKNWGVSSEKTFGEHNTFEPLETKDGGGHYYDTAYKLQSGVSIYFDTATHNWTSDNHNVYAHLWDSVNGSSEVNIQLTNVKGWDNNNTHLFEFVVPGTNDFWGGLCFYRATSIDGEWTNRTNDVSGDASNNVFKLYYDNYSYGSWDWNYSDAERSEALAQCILDQTDTICEDFNTNDGTEFASAWTTIVGQYNGTNAQVKNIFQSATYTKSGTGLDTVVTKTGDTNQKVAEGAARYDYIVGKYNGVGDISDFASRNPAPIGANRIIPSVSNSTSNSISLIAVISLSAVSLVAVGGYFFIKRKQD